MGNIVLLDDLTINKIAAGEVVERPASVVKEMVENSIDAGATKITVEIKNGGISFIRISDNGRGIAEDDMEIAFERHATSKIRVADDIVKVTSMGFRGEALASIAAIANVEMISRTADSEIGHKIVVEGGKVLEQSEIGSPVGTTITVKNLFYNTPVRYKFLKKDYTESGYIEDCVSRLALVNKNISFKLINSGKTIIHTNGNNDIKSVIYSIYGKDVAENIVEVEHEYEGIKVSGIVGNAEIARSNRSNQLFFVNKRFIKNRTLNAAAEQALKNIIPSSKYGFLVLNIEIDPMFVDVNVHPAKLEVRFEDENKVFKAVYATIKEANNIIEENKEQIKNEEVQEFKDEKIYKIDSLEQQSDEVAKAIREDELFGKRNKTPFFKKNKLEEDKEKDEKDNLLEEVYKFRKGLKEIGVSEVPMSVYTPFIDEEQIQKEVDKNVEHNVEMDNKQEQVESNENLANGNTVEIPVVADQDNEDYTQKDEDIIKPNSVPTEQKVQEMTKELIKQRESNEILENDIKNSKIEKNEENSDDENDKKFDDMYMKIFGDKQIISTEEEQKVLSEKERKMLADIKSTVRPIKENDGVEENEEGIKIQEIKTDNEISKDDLEKSDNKIIEFQEEKVNEIKIDDKQQSLLDEKDSYDDLKKLVGKNYKFVGIAFSNYIIVEVEDEMCIIDWKAASERIVYEMLKKSYNSTEKDSQAMLMADIINLNHKQTELIKENLDLFLNVGFKLEAFGENTIKLTSVPGVCINMNTKHLFLELLDDTADYSKNSSQPIEDRFILDLSKKVANVSDIRIDESEVDRVLKALLNFDNPYVCSNGKRIAMEISKYDIERKFNRK